MLQRILIIRRDNIGDLVCTLPLIRRLRQQYPQAWIGALVTRYNAEVLHANPDLNAVFAYTKAKHLERGESALGAMLARLRLLWWLRRENLDLVLLPASGNQASARRMARLVGAKRVLAQDDVPGDPALTHEVSRTANFLQSIDIPPGDLPAASLVPRVDALLAARSRLGGDTASGPVIGLHISSRKPSQRWPASRFIELIGHLHRNDPSCRFALFWAPGDENNPLHPGDDGKAREIIEACAGLPLVPMLTHSLSELIGGLAAVDMVVCSDGGHMHLAAGVGKPIVCLFGKSDAERWHPWGVPYRLLQPKSLDVADISVEQVLDAITSLRAEGETPAAVTATA